MRARSFAAAAVLAVSSMAHATPASAADPAPACTASINAVATSPTPTGVLEAPIVGTAVATVYCQFDVLTTPPADYLAGWAGDIDVSIASAETGNSFNCSSGIVNVPAVGPVLVLTWAQPCVIPASSPDYYDALVAKVTWQAYGPTWIHCCGSYEVPVDRV